MCPLLFKNKGRNEFNIIKFHKRKIFDKPTLFLTFSAFSLPSYVLSCRPAKLSKLISAKARMSAICKILRNKSMTRRYVGIIIMILLAAKKIYSLF